jgi:uncharacterized protein with HEPN domain
MSKRNDILLLEDIAEACNKIERYVKGMTFDEFKNDDKTSDAVIRNFEIIGEAANRLSQEIILKYDTLQWRQIIGLRNRLIHGYFGVDYQILWIIISQNLSPLKKQINEIINKLKQ